MPEANKEILEEMFKDKVEKKEKENSLTMEQDFDIIVVMDRSGSMCSIKDDAIGGTNTFIEEQQKEDKGNTYLSLVQFDDQYGDPAYWRTPITEVEPLTRDTFVPRGMTALYDAFGKTIAEVRERRASGEITGRVQFVIQTDGGENASKEYTSLHDISDLIKEVKEEGWGDFIFLGANIDAFGMGSTLGVASANTVNYAATSVGVRSAGLFAAAQTKAFRYGTTLDSAQVVDMQHAVAEGTDVSDLYASIDASIDRGDSKDDPTETE